MPSFAIYRIEYYRGEIEAESLEAAQQLLDEGGTDVDTWTLVNAEEGIQGEVSND